MKIYVTIGFLLFLTTYGYCQIDSNTKASLYFQEAEARFQQNDFEEAIEYAIKAENELGRPYPRTLRLKIIAYYNNGDFQRANRDLEIFINDYQDQASEKIRNDVLSYFVKIETAMEEQAKENQRLAIEREKENTLKKKMDEANQYAKREIELIWGIEEVMETGGGNGTGLVPYRRILKQDVVTDSDSFYISIDFENKNYNQSSWSWYTVRQNSWDTQTIYYEDIEKVKIVNTFDKWSNRSMNDLRRIMITAGYKTAYFYVEKERAESIKQTFTKIINRYK